MRWLHVYWAVQAGLLTPLTFARHRLSPLVAFVKHRNSRFNFRCYTQREATPTQKSARKWHCDLSRLLAWKITKDIHSCKPASLNRQIGWGLRVELFRKMYYTPCGLPHAVFWVFISISGGCMLLCKKFIMAEDRHNYAAHNDILMWSWCFCWYVTILWHNPR